MKVVLCDLTQGNAIGHIQQAYKKRKESVSVHVISEIRQELGDIVWDQEDMVRPAAQFLSKLVPSTPSQQALQDDPQRSL